MIRPRLPHVLIPQERLLLVCVIVSIWTLILAFERLTTHPSSTWFILGGLMAYGILIGLANWHHRRQSRRPQPEPNPHYTPSVSIVIPAHNEASVITDTVLNMLAQTYPHFDVWVIDDRSQDGTKDVLEALATSLNDPRFHFWTRPDDRTPGKSAVLNDALTLTQSDIILVMDADGRLAPDAVQLVIAFLEPDDVGAVQVRKSIMNANESGLLQCQELEYLMDAHVQIGRDVIQGAVELRGNGQFVKRKALNSVNGWTEDSITDDLDLSTKLHAAGWDIRFVANVMVQEQGIPEFGALIRQRRRWAEGSLKRYLEYAFLVMTSPHISHRAKLDMFFYFLQFILPIWLMSDLVIQLIELILLGWPKHPISSVIVLPILGIVLISAISTAILQFRPKLSWIQAGIGAITTALYMMIVWVPVVLWITFKIVARPDEGASNWGKTQRYGTP